MHAEHDGARPWLPELRRAGYTVTVAWRSCARDSGSFTSSQVGASHPHHAAALNNLGGALSKLDRHGVRSQAAPTHFHVASRRPGTPRRVRRVHSPLVGRRRGATLPRR